MDNLGWYPYQQQHLYRTTLFCVLMFFSFSAATSLMELWNTPGVAEKVEETARVYFANSILTINLIPALLVGALLLFCKYTLKS